MTAPAIAVEGLVKRFGSVQALDGVDFEVAPGTVFGLLGPNGAGKTTAVRVLATIIRPDSGRANILGRDVVREASAVRYLIGLAGQNAAVDPHLTGRENLRLIGRLTHLPRVETTSRADDLLQRFELSEAANRPVRTYSGGMRRRLDIASALVQRPPVLILDEPTTGLDLHSRNELWVMIKELISEGSTILLTTQYLEEADRLADQIVVMDQGRVIANDTPGALKSRLGSTVIELGMADESEAVKTFELISGRVSDQPEREGSMVRITSNHGPRILIDVLRTLDAQGLVPSALAVREPSLDDVFLALTGHHAEGSAEESLKPSKRGAA